MIERVNRQFQLLAAERKKFDQIIKTVSLNESLFKSYVTAIQSVSMTACNITQSFTEILSYSQIKMLSKSVSQVVVELVSKLEQYNSTIRKMRSQRQQQGKKIKSQYCSICMQNIHENNIKQAKMYLEQEAKQSFHKAVQQVQKMANQPLFTTQQNNAYDEKLYLHLAQKQKVLNTNCRRMQEFVDIVNATLDDLSKLKDISIEQQIQGNVQYMSNFAPATKLGEQVSKFLKKQFSEKVPPWINKILTRIMQWYLHQKSQKQAQKIIQTDHYESQQSKQLKQVIKQIQKLSKQKQELNEQLKILKACNKKLEQINMQNINIISNLNRLINKSKINNNGNNFRETTRNGKNNSLTKSGIKFVGQVVGKDVTPVSEEVEASYINAIEEDQAYTISKKKKNQISNALPQIRRNKVGTMRSLGRDLDYSDQALNYLNETEKDIKHGRNYEQIGKSMGKSHKHIQHRQVSPSKKGEKDKQTQKDQEQQQQKQRIEQRSGKISGIQHNEQGAQEKRRKKQTKKQKKEMRSSVELKKDIKSNMKMLRENGEMKKSKQDMKLTKAGINRMSNANQYGPYTSKSRDQSYAHLEQFVTNSKMTEIKKKSQQHTELHNKTQKKQKQQNKVMKNSNNETIQMNMNTCKQNNQNINQIGEQYCIYTNELAVMKRISKDLSNQILSKKINLYNKAISNDVNVGNFNKNKEYSVEALNKYQILNTRTQQLNNKAVRQNYSLIQKLDPNNRNSSYERKQGNKQLKEKIRNSQNKNSCGYYKQRAKVQSKYSKMPEYGEQSLCSSWNQTEQNQRKIFEILKNNKALNEHLNYQDFTSLFLTTQKQQKQQIDSSTSSAVKSPIQKHYLHSRKPSNPNQLLNPSPCPQPCLQQKQAYINLFISKSHAYKYEQTTKKSYHRNKMRQLTQQQHQYCYEMFCHLIQCKKIQKSVYQQFCSILRYPFQTLYNQFDVLNFITDITFDTFQYYFRKIVWMHRKCEGHGVVCQHIEVVGRELESIVKASSQSPV